MFSFAIFVFKVIIYIYLIPYSVKAFTNKEATGCIYEEAIGAINQAAIGAIIATRNPPCYF